MNNTELQEFLQQSTFAYRFLSRAFIGAPDKAFIDIVLDEPATQTLLPEFYREAQSADREALRTDLAADYNQLFLGMSPHPVAPYESVYTSEEGLLMQEARDEMVELYKHYGLAVDTSFDLPEDHIALQLELAAHISQLALDAFSADDEEGALSLAAELDIFTDKHLNWVNAFCDDVQKHARTSFYYNLADLARKTIAL
ncbi:molecular chaperone TorD family protein [Eggerthellaceae bacterium 3-80]|nr:hypothetical protein D7W09_00885 [bacterium D16-34]